MKNKRIGKILGKTVLLDTPPYGDKKARANEIITTVDNITFNGVLSDTPLYFCSIKKRRSEGIYETFFGKTFNYNPNGGYSNDFDYEATKYEPGFNIIGGIYCIVRYTSRYSIYCLVNSNSSYFSNIESGDMLVTPNKLLDETSEIMAFGNNKLIEQLINFKHDLCLITDEEYNNIVGAPA